MSKYFEQCLDFIKLCSLDQKMSLLKHLQNDIKSVNDVQSHSSKNTPDPDHFSFENFVSYHPSYIEDSTFLPDLWSELESLNFPRKVNLYGFVRVNFNSLTQSISILE